MLDGFGESVAGADCRFAKLPSAVNHVLYNAFGEILELIPNRKLLRPQEEFEIPGKPESVEKLTFSYRGFR
jgi:hypothetical protein